MLTAIRQWVLKTMMKDQTGVMRTLPKKDLVDFNVAITAERLMKNGIDPNALKNANQVENAINSIENPPKININTGRNQSGIRNTESAKVIDMEGKEIPPGSKIMGGKATETEAEIAARMSKENKESAQRIREKSIAKFETDQNLTELEKAIDNASPGFAGDRKYDAQLVADNLANDRFGKEFYDLNQKQQMDLYDEALEGLANQKRDMPDPEDFATGGRAGFKSGLGKGFFEFLKKFKVKQSGDDLKDFLSKRQFMKDAVGNTEKNRKARQLAEIKEAMNDAKGYQFPSGKELRTDIEKTIGPILLKDRKLNSEGGRAGYKFGIGPLFNFLNKKSPMKAYTDYLESVKKRMKAGKEAEVAGEVIPIAAGGALITNQLKKKLKAMNEEQKKEFKKDMEKKADGGRIGYADGTPSFEEYMQERQGIEKKQNFERLYKEYLEDLRRKGVMEQKQMAAEGGRIGLKDGMDRRTFLKIMGGLASVPILGKFLKPAKVASKAVKAAPVVSKTTPPAYFFELAEKIKTLGRVTDGPQERLKIHTMPAKDGKSELMLTEDIGTGEMQIKKIGKEGDEMTTEVQTMEYTPGSSQADEATQGIPADTYDEYTEFNSRIIKDEYNDPDIVDGIKVDEIIEEVKDAPSIKKAGGGIARMLGE